MANGLSSECWKMTEFLMVVIGGAKLGAMYALATIGLIVIYKATRTVNFAQGALVMLGAYGSYIIVVLYEWPYWTSYLVVPMIVGLISVVVEAVVLRPMRRSDFFTVIITTIFVGVALSETFRLTQNTEMLAVPATFIGPPIFIGHLIVTLDALWVLSGATVTAIIAALIFERAPIGRGMRAVAANIRGAQLCGYSTDGIFAAAWFMGGALAGLAGVFAAPSKGVSPELALSTIAASFVAAVIGGFGSLRGAIVGGLVLGLAETIAAAYGPSALKNATTFVVLLVVLLLRPEGLFPERVIRRV
jgi:branched-chain amino acid transport system permease protein